MNIFIDLETIPTQDEAIKKDIEATVTHPGNISKKETIDAWIAEKKPAAVEDAIAKTSFDGGLGMIACIGVAIDDQPTKVFYADDWRNGEAGVIKNAFDFIDKASITKYEHGPSVRNDDFVFIGHNLVGFDLPFLRKRCVVLGIRPPSYMPFTAKPWDKTLYDTMLQWDAKNFVSMDKLCKILGIAGKGDMDGSKVWPAVRDGRIAEVAEYCHGDIERTRAIFNRMTFAGGAA